MTNRRSVLAGLTAMAAFGGFPAQAGKLFGIVASTGMIADTVRVISGDGVQLKALMGPGIDPHAYRQTRSDILAMTRADLVFWHGLYLEAQMEDFFVDLSRKRQVVAVADALPKDVLLSHDDYADKYDPHVWMDPDLWTLIVDVITDALTAAKPNAADTFQQNAAAYKIELARLATYAKDSLAQVPSTSRVLVTAHDAFGYFGRAYGFEVLGIQGISTESEAGLARIRDLVTLLIERDIGAVFVESSVSDRNVRALIEGAAAQGHDVQIGGELFSDAMGQSGTYEGTYLGMIDHNVTTIARALGAPSVPAGGMSGRLAAGS